MAKKYWLFKSEPDAYSYADLLGEKDQTGCWDGIRNYQARNLLRDDIRVGDSVLFYHSSTHPTAVVGKARVVKAGYPDHTQFDPDSKYFDPKSKREDPRWVMVDIKADGALMRPITLAEIRSEPMLREMKLLQKGSRLSIQPVSSDEWKAIISLSKKAAEEPRRTKAATNPTPLGKASAKKAKARPRKKA